MIEFWYRWDFKHRTNFTRHIMSTMKYTFWRIFYVADEMATGVRYLSRITAIVQASNTQIQSRAIIKKRRKWQQSKVMTDDKLLPSMGHWLTGATVSPIDVITFTRITRVTRAFVLWFSQCSLQRSMRRVRPFDVLNNNVVFINGKIKCTSIERHVRINRGFVHQLFSPRS